MRRHDEYGRRLVGRDPAYIRGRLRQGSSQSAPAHSQIIADEDPIRARCPQSVRQSAVEHDGINGIATQANGALLHSLPPSWLATSLPSITANSSSVCGPPTATAAMRTSSTGVAIKRPDP